MRKELFEKTRELEQYAKSDELSRIDKESKELDSKLAECELMLIKNQRASSTEIEKKSAEISKENKALRAEFYKELGDVDKRVRDTKLKMVEEQAKLLDQKTAKLNKSLEEVEELKKELRVIVKQAKAKGASAETLKSVKRLEPKLKEKGWFAKVKDAVADFLFEEPMIEDEEEEFFEEKPKKRKQKKDEDEGLGIWGWLIPLLLLLVIIGLGVYFFHDDIARGFAGLGAGLSNLFGPKTEQPPATGVENETEQPPKGPVIFVYEGDFVDIVPNMSDADNDKLVYSFTAPLNATGQWKTAIGDAGSYPITVTVSDGEKESTMNFTLVVNKKTE